MLIKKNNLLILSIITLIICFFGYLLRYSFAMDSVDNSTTITFKKEELQDIIVSTGLSYLYNKKYSDYDQYSMEEETRRRKTFNFRTFNESPEMVSRSSKFYIDCSSFVSSVIKHSLGYDFSNFYSETESYIFYDENSIWAGKNKNMFTIAYNQYGKAINTNFFSNIGSSRVSDAYGKQYINVANSEYKDIYKIADTDIVNENINNDIVIYYYGVTSEDDEDRKAGIKSNIENLLEPGDIVIYRRKRKNDAEAGHVMLYVGNAIDSQNTGLIHASGTSYIFDESKDVNNGFDDFSVRYDNIGYLLEKIFNSTDDIASSSRAGSSFTILRPINNYYNVEKNIYEIEGCLDGNCDVGYLNENAIMRDKLNQLRIEQYASVTTKSISDENTLKKTVSSYNSVNDGDTIRYNLYVLNEAQMYYCNSGDKEVTGSVGIYDNEPDCENAGYEWKQRTNSSVTTYKNLTIIGEIPENTKFTGSCNKNCTYDIDNNLIKWNISTISPTENNEVTFWYEVEVDIENTSEEKNNIVNKGMKIYLPQTEYNLDSTMKHLEDTYHLSPITIKVNPTINEMSMNLLEENVEKFNELYSAGKITYNNTVASGYKQDLDNISSSFSLSELGFIKMIYYNTFGIDLNYLVKKNIIPALFNSIEIIYPDNESTTVEINYLKKTEEEINNIDSTDTKSINLNKMLVKGMYGGQLLKSNDNLDRAKYLRVYDLEVGDIIVFFEYNYPEEGEDVSAAGIQDIGAYMFYGLSNGNSAVFVRFENDGLIKYEPSYDKTGLTLFRELYRKGLFVVLRPSQLYGTTVKFDYNGATTFGDNLCVAYNTYRNLTTPTKENKTVKLVYNQELTGYQNTFEGTNTFIGWYSDDGQMVSNNSPLISNNTHTLYAKWDSDSITLPNPTEIVGYRIEGWYSDAELNTKVANAGEKYEITENITLYAKWEKLITITSDIINIDSNNKIMSNIELNTTFNNLIGQINTNESNITAYDNYKKELSKEEKIKTGYIIKFGDNTEYELSVLGDVTGTGNVTIGDVANLYQALKGKIDLNNVQYLAGDVEIDGEIAINDVAKLYAYLKKRISSLK